ncbi:Vacuolar membrane protein pep3 [Trichuris trichiura]|uniref:Vacuolar membrane protein pep3 n=1 Tax=Trichuris trichiura TaxID=36087 RepID=A0A077ZAQ4_TRITR|nr:Vacuolar membrane protein pep3 [Trichuris trichiura]
MDNCFQSSLLRASGAELKYLLERKLDSLQANKPTSEALLAFALLRIDLSEMRRLQLENAWKNQQLGLALPQSKNYSLDKFVAFKNNRAKAALFGLNSSTIEMIKAYGDVDLLLNYLESSRDFLELVSLQIQFGKYDAARETLKLSKSQEILNNAVPHAIDVDKKLLTSLIPNAILSSECLASFYRILLREKQELDSLGLITGSLGKFAWRDRLIQNFLISLYAKISNSSATPQRLIKALPLPLFDIEQVLLIEDDARSRLQPVFALWRETIESHIADLEYPSETRERLENAAKLLQRLTAKTQGTLDSAHGKNSTVDESHPFSAILLQVASQIEDDKLKSAEKLRLCELLSSHSEDGAKSVSCFDEAVDIAAAIKTQLEAHSLGYSILKPGGKCSSCGLKISARSQEVFFACLHSFHLSCFEKEVSLLVESVRSKAKPANGVKKTRVDENVPTSECPFCGNILAELIDVSFDEKTSQHLEWP